MQFICLYWLHGLTLEDTVTASGMTLWEVRKLKEEAIPDLGFAILAVLDRAETETAEDKLLSQWGEVRPDLHWVPDDRYEKCDCSRCEAFRRRCAPLGGRSAPRSLTASTTEGLSLILTDEHGYKFPELCQVPTAFLRGDARLSPVATRYQLIAVRQGQSPTRIMLKESLVVRNLDRLAARPPARLLRALEAAAPSPDRLSA